MIKLLQKLKEKKIICSSNAFIAGYSLFTLIFYNFIFWQKSFDTFAFEASQAILIFTFLLIVFTIFLLFFSILFNKFTIKPLAIFFILANACALYFIVQYGIAIDKAMIINSIETDKKEVLDLLSHKMLIHLAIFAIIPIFIISKITVKCDNFKKELLSRIKFVLVVFLVTILLVSLQYRQVATTIRENRPNLGYLLPNSYITSIIKVVKSKFKKDEKILPIGEDAQFLDKNKTLVILVVGETARAANFSLYGYNRQTNPLLSKENNLVVLKNSTSCGTSTAASVPCLFSHLGREKFVDESKKYQPLPSFTAKLKINTIWLGNNSGGCKGMCNDAKTEYFMNNKDKDFCLDDGCYDGIMIDAVRRNVKNYGNDNTFIVIHENGSHGPRYNHRYPKQFEIFKPVCDRVDVSKCSQEELINAYDNTILYNDYFLHEVIKIVKENAKIPAIVIYASDHGESLGENGIYLHGFPYNFAPSVQKTIPFLIWTSDAFQKRNKINNSCLGKNSSYSHDNIFHSIVGAFGIKTKIYNKDLDIFSNCQK